VTQQIKLIEKYLSEKIIERKKNGIKLTEEGEEFYRVVAELEKSIQDAERDILKIINKKLTFRLGASFTIGNYVIPGACLNTMGKVIDNDISLSIEGSDVVIQRLKEHKLDVGLIESPVMDDSMIYREWLEDELVIFSSSPIPKILKREELYSFRWVCREEGGYTKRIISDIFKELGVSCKSFNVLSEVSNSTTALQMIKKSPKDSEAPVVSIISKHAIADEVQNGELFEARLRGYKMTRKFYIVYSKESKHNAYIDKVVNFILSGHC